MVNIELAITKELILKKCSQEQIYSHYLGKYKIGSAMKCPWREDRTPSFSLFYNSTGVLLWIDHSYHEIGNVFQLVQRIFNLRFVETLKKISVDLHLNTITNFNNNPLVISYIHNNPVEFSDEERPFTSIDLQYWENYGISQKTLFKYNIFAINKLFINGKWKWSYSNSCPIYKFLDQESIKYYRPLAPKHSKWKGNGVNIIQGWEQLPKGKLDMLVITKARKDIMTLDELGIFSIATITESKKFTTEQISNIKDKANIIVSVFDNDVCGLKQKVYLESFGIKGFIIEEKSKLNKRLDISDFRKEYGKEKLINKLKSFKILK